MDHKRIEWLFFVVFFLIDIYLGIEILRSPVNLSNADTTTRSVAIIRNEMKSDNIDLPDKISDAPDSGYYLATKNRDYLSGKVSSLTNVNARYSKSDNVLYGAPREAILLSKRPKEALQQIKDFKNDPKNVPYGKEFKYEPDMSSEDNYVFVQNSDYGEIYANSAQLNINVKNNQIINFTERYMGQASPVRELQSTISAWRAVRAMYTDRELTNNSRVTQVKLGYSKLTEVRGSTILLPTWLVWVENKTTKNITMKRVNAYTAQMLQSSTYNVEKQKGQKLKVSVLASGSTGNTSLIVTGQHKILMVAGLSGKKTKDLLAEVGVDINEIDMAFLSHDHTDHSGGLGVLMRRYPKIDAFANSGTWQYLLDTQKIGKLPAEQMNTIEPGQTKTFGDVDITAFATSHDAAEPQYYVFTSGGKRVAFLTDTGYVSEEVEGTIEDADAYMMEFNYDNMMLRDGPYSWALKQRILSDVGHLSNDEAAQALVDVVTPKTKHIFLAHRSQHNNTEYLAHETAKEMLLEGDANLDDDVKIIDTEPNQPTKLVEIQQFSQHFFI